MGNLFWPFSQKLSVDKGKHFTQAWVNPPTKKKQTNQKTNRQSHSATKH